MNKINLILAACILPLTVSATSPTNYFGGAYVGGGLGASWSTATQQLGFNPGRVANTWIYNLKQSQSNSSLMEQLFLGYGYLFPSKPLYVALEAIADFTQLSQNMSSPALIVNIKQNNAYGGRVKLGYVDRASLLYLLVGLEGTSLKNNISFPNGGLYNSYFMSLQDINGKSNNALITQVGAGFNFAFATNWQAQLEYAHNFYSNKNYDLNHKFITFNNPIGTYTASLEGNQVSFGIKYMWKH